MKYIFRKWSSDHIALLSEPIALASHFRDIRVLTGIC